jgi:hypothetical protein
MMDFGEDERRKYFRITDNLLLELRQVSSEEAEVIKKSLSHSIISPEIPIQLPVKASIPDDIRNYLVALEKKLDLIIDMLSGRYMPFEQKFVKADISGSGIRYQSDSKIDIDTFVELRLGFAFSIQPKIAVLGKVLRSIPKSVEGKSIWNTAIGFIAISEKDRDSLISYIFSRERQRLQSMKELLI